MPAEAENIQYLYLVLTHDGTPTVSHSFVMSSYLQLSRSLQENR